MRTAVILVWISILLGCSPTGSISADVPDAGAIKLPPTGKPGEDSAPGCEGVTEGGECRDGVALYCDAGSGSLRQVDCRALGLVCAMDPDRGAICADLGNQSGDPGSPCGGVVNETGYCSDQGAAVWCDVEGNQVVSWSCGQSGLSCAVNDCQSGAYCCEDAPQANECPALGFYGECAGNTARYCNSNDTLIELDCTAQGKECVLDVCAEGAYCCSPANPPPSECDTLGSYGECGGAAGTTVRYCLGGTLREYECTTAGESCMLDVCFNGAECCTQAEYDATCQSLGTRGICAGSDGNVATFCTGGEIRRNDCTAMDKTCSVDVCGAGAWCC
jgi:hypothetical protein